MAKERWKKEFLIGLRQGRPVDQCARMLAGLTLQQVHDARQEDPEFAAEWDAVVPLESFGPKRELTAQALEALLWAQCSDEETAAYFGMEVGEFKAIVAIDDGLTRAYKLGPAGGRAALKRSQMERAMSGDTTAQTWLGKQYLGQADKVDSTITHKRELSPREMAEGMLLIMKQGEIDAAAAIDITAESIEVGQDD